ncbi:unnamed protein product [Owenia fusiformis]|uniref:Uncharacterized protein n=1 Tax=Owenia fusiformis TaxID=6347 RepID=A0A8J1UYJ8_OWEFU|nr:unnamed protein product [Owenia fusiformis]
MHRTTKIKITELNPHLMCVLCGGYYIDATTIIECLHSFCRTCIVRYLETSKYCPICDVMVHKTKPHLHIRADHTLQDLVYKLVPGLFKNEMKQRRVFFKDNPPVPGSSHTPEEKGDVAESQRNIYTEDENISLSLEYSTTGRPPDESEDTPTEKCTKGGGDTNKMVPEKRYLLCPAAMSIYHIKKFIRMKFSLLPSHNIVLFKTDEPLSDDYTLMDIAYIYSWRRRGPLRLFYCIYEIPEGGIKRRKLSQETSTSVATPTRSSTSNGDSATLPKTTDTPETTATSKDISSPTTEGTPISHATNGLETSSQVNNHKSVITKVPCSKEPDVVVSAEDARQAAVACAASKLTEVVSSPPRPPSLAPTTFGVSSVMSTKAAERKTAPTTKTIASMRNGQGLASMASKLKTVAMATKSHGGLSGLSSSTKTLNSITKLNLPRPLNHVTPPSHATNMAVQHHREESHHSGRGLTYGPSQHCGVTSFGAYYTTNNVRQNGHQESNIPSASHQC